MNDFMSFISWYSDGAATFKLGHEYTEQIPRFINDFFVFTIKLYQSRCIN